jgi:hypothetical protein
MSLCKQSLDAITEDLGRLRVAKTASIISTAIKSFAITENPKNLEISLNEYLIY